MSEQQQLNATIFETSDEYRPGPHCSERPFWQDANARIGIHTSISGGFSDALETARRLGANALQIFSASPRMWAREGSRIPEADAKEFRDRRRELGLGPLAIHANYLINLASPSPVLRTRSVQAFYQEIVRARALGADFLVVHPGSAVDGPREAAVSAVGQSLKQATRDLDLGGLKILIENTAGQGACLGCGFDELRHMLDACPELPLAVCIDTAHLFASGCDIRTAEGLNRTIGALAASIGLDRVCMIHANDSKSPLGSRVDRHEHLGKGRIGIEAFRRIVNHPLLAHLPFILETPIDKPGDDCRNVSALWKLKGKTVRGSGDGMKPRRSGAVRRRAKVRSAGAAQVGRKAGSRRAAECQQEATRAF